VIMILFATLGNGLERWIYLTSMVRRTINAVFLAKPHLGKHHRCAAGGCVAPANKARQSAGVNAFQATGGRAREELRHRSERSR
jgi:hypothetical protein